MSEPTPKALSTGQIFHGRYEIVRNLKTGGMGAVYEVVHLETRRRGALKVMLPNMVADPELRARFKLEAAVAADIHSEHIVETFDAGVDPESGAPFLVMELLRGEDLKSLLRQRGRLTPEETVTLLSQAALALDKTHAAGVIHRDLKPENLFVTYRDDGSPRLKVLDFGIAKVVAQSTLPNATRGVGTPIYMSPEQVRGDGTIGPPADLYALGHIAYVLLVGEPYWHEESLTLNALYPLLGRVMQGATEPATARALRRARVSLPPRFDAWFAKATAVRAASRYERATEMTAALASALGVSASAPPSSAHVPSAAPVAREPSPPQGSRQPWALVVTAVIGIIVGVLAVRWIDARGHAAPAAAPPAVVVAPAPAGYPPLVTVAADTASAPEGPTAAVPSTEPSASAPAPAASESARPLGTGRTRPSPATAAPATGSPKPAARRPGKAYDPLDNL